MGKMFATKFTERLILLIYEELLGIKKQKTKTGNRKMSER